MSLLKALWRDEHGFSLVETTILVGAFGAFVLTAGDFIADGVLDITEAFDNVSGD